MLAHAEAFRETLFSAGRGVQNPLCKLLSHISVTKQNMEAELRSLQMIIPRVK